MLFLPGEVVIDYALRLKREYDGRRIWVTAYANDVPCYIASERVMREGGYEVDSSGSTSASKKACPQNSLALGRWHCYHLHEFSL